MATTFIPRFNANILFTTLIIFTGLLTFIFLEKERMLSRNDLIQNEYYQYLKSEHTIIDKLKFTLQDKDRECKKHKITNKDKIYLSSKNNHFTLYFQCSRIPFFIKPKPTKESYISFSKIEEYLNISTYNNNIIKIRSLSDLPTSSINNPIVAIALNDIDESLTKDIYGIIITSYYFDIKGKGKMYGTLYSSYNNEREERNLRHKKEVIDNIEKKFFIWKYIPNSSSLFKNETD